MRRLYESEWYGFGVSMWIYEMKSMVENWEAAGYILFHSAAGARGRGGWR
jgi:hypothetical protein